MSKLTTVSRIDPYTKEVIYIDGSKLSGIEYYRRKSEWETYWQPLLKLWTIVMNLPRPDISERQL